MPKKYCTGTWGTPVSADAEFIEDEVPQTPDGFVDIEMNVWAHPVSVGKMVMRTDRPQEVRELIVDRQYSYFYKEQTPVAVLNAYGTGSGVDFTVLFMEKMHTLCKGQRWYIIVSEYCQWSLQTIVANIHSPVLDQSTTALIFNGSSFEFDDVPCRDIASIDTHKSILHQSVYSAHMYANVVIKRGPGVPKKYEESHMTIGANTKHAKRQIELIKAHFGNSLESHYADIKVFFYAYKDNDKVATTRCTESVIAVLSAILPISSAALQMMRMPQKLDFSTGYVYGDD